METMRDEWQEGYLQRHELCLERVRMMQTEETVPEQKAMPGRQELKFRMKRFPRDLQTFRLSMTKKFRWPTAVI